MAECYWLSPYCTAFCLSVCMCILACVCVWVWMGAFLTWLIRQWRQLTLIFWEKNKTDSAAVPPFPCCGFLSSRSFTHLCLLDCSKANFELRLETTWLQVERRMTTEESHWTLTLCTCSSKVSLFLSFYGCCDMWCVAVGNHSGRPSLKRVKEILFQSVLCYFDMVMYSMTL